MYVLVSNSPVLFSFQISKGDNICTLKGAAILTHNERVPERECYSEQKITNDQFWIICLCNSTDNGQPRVCGESSELSKVLHQEN